MEDGKGLVAVVQGSWDSGVSVMIISRKHLMNSVKPIKQSTTRSSTGTSMEHYVDQNTSTQISAGRYATSYQLAHCHFYSTPTGEMQEFHKQRDELRQRLIYSAGTSPSQQTHAFAQSLRRYPLSPDRSESAELVQRLLNYTQTKYLSRNSSTSMRSLHPSRPRQSKELEGSGVISKLGVTKAHSKSKKPKNYHKYLEAKDTETNCRILSTATTQTNETKTSKGTVDKTDSKSKKNKKIQSYTRNMPRNDSTFSRGYTHKSNLPSESYNYLKASSGGKQSFSGHRAELRYLNEIKQFLQDYLRQLRSDENRAICPNMMNRYKQHRRKIHNDAMSPVEDAQAHQHTSTSKDFPGSARCRPPPSTQSSQFIKRIPCPCKSEHRRDSAVMKMTDTILDFLKKISVYTDEAPEILIKRDKMLQQLAAKIISLKDQQASNERVKEDILKCLDNLPMWFPGTADDWNRLKRQVADEIVGESYDITSLKGLDDLNEIEDVIHKWLNELPVYADNTPESNDKRGEIVKRLANNINNLKGRADFDDIAKDEINIYIDNLPMWFPAVKRDQIADNLLNSIKDVMGRDYNESVDAIDKEVKKQTLEWLKELPLYADETPQIKAKSEEMVKELAAKLNSLKDYANYKKRARDEIDKCIEKLPLTFSGSKIEQNKFKNQIADNLLKNLKNAIGESYRDIDASDTKVEKQTLEWLKYLPVYANENPQNKATSIEMVKNLAVKLEALKDRDNFENKARDEILKCIEDFPFRFTGTKQEQENFKNDISNNLLRDLSDIKNKTSRGGDDFDKDVEGQTIEWLKEIPVYADETPENKIKSKKMVKELAAKINSLKGRDSFENRAKYEIDKCVESLPLKFPGTKREQNMLKNQMADNLLDNLSDIMGKSNIDEEATDKAVEEQTLQWLKKLAIYSDATPQNKAESKKIVKELAATLKNLKSLDNFEYRAKDEINKCIDSLPLRFPGTKREQEILKNQIADGLFNNLSNVMGKCRKNENNISEEQILKLIKRVCDYEDLSPINREKIKKMAQELCTKLNRNKGHADYDNKTQEMIKKYIANVVTMISDDIAGNISDYDTDDPRTKKDDVSKSTGNRRATKNRKNSTVKEQILDWLNELPAYSGNNSQNKADSEQIVKQLADELESLKGYDDFDKKAKGKIHKCLENLPLKLSGTKRNQDNMKKQLADNLINNLNVDEFGNSKDIFGKSGVQRSRRREDDNNNKVEQILDWLKELPAYAENTPKNKTKTESMVKQLADKLENIKDRDDFEEKAKYEIHKCIENLPFSLPGTKKNQDILKDQLADYWLDNLYVDELSSSKNSSHKSSKSFELLRVATDPVDASKNVVHDQIYEWLKRLPVYKDDTLENKIDKEKKIKQLVSQLDSIKGRKDYDERAKDEIFKYINSLPMSFPGDKQDQKNSGNRMADNLLRELNSVEMIKFKTAVKKYFDDINFEDDYGNAIDKDKMLDDFVINLKPIMNKSSDELEEEVTNIIKKLPIKVNGDKNKTISKIANNLVNEVKHFKNEEEKDTMNFADKISEEHIWDWLEDATNVPKHIKKNNKDQIQTFAHRIKKMQSEGYDDDDVIEDEIKDFLNSLPENGILVKPKDKNNLVKNLLHDIKSKPKQRKHWVQKENIPQLMIDEISEVVDDLPINVSTSKREEIKKKIGEVLAQNVNDFDSEIVKKEIEDILKKEGHLLGLQAKGLASALISKLKDMPYSEFKENVKKGANHIATNKGTGKSDNDSEMNEEKIWDWLEDATNVSKQIKKKNKENVQNFADKVKNMQSEGYDDDIIEDEIKDFLNSLPENGIQVNPKDKGQLLKTIHSEIKSKPNQRKYWAQKENIPDEISELVDDLPINVSLSKREEIKKDIADVLAQNMNGSDKKKVKREIEDILKKECHMPGSQAQSSASALISKLKDMPYLEIEGNVKKGANHIDEGKGTAKYADYSELNEEHVWDWLDNTTNVPKQIKNKNKEHVQNFADKVKRMQSEGYDDDVIEEEIKDFINSLPENGISINPEDKSQLVRNFNYIKSKPNQRKRWAQNEKIPQSIIMDEISELADNNLPVTVSPNRRQEIKIRIADVLAQNVDGFDSETVKKELGDILKREGKMPASEAKSLTNALINIAKGTPMPHRYTDSELEDNVKEGVISILGNFNIPVADVEKLEDSLAEVLTDQIVRGTDDNSTEEQIISILENANLPDDDVRNITNRLMKRNRETSISDRSPDSYSKQYTSLPNSKSLHHNRKPDFTTSTPCKDKFYTSPKRFSIIKPLQPQTLHDNEFTESKIEYYTEPQTQGPNMNSEVKDLISKWTQAIQPKLVHTTEHKELKSPADTRSILSQDTNQFVAENLKGVILEWLKQQPLYIRRTSYEKLVQEHLVNDLVEGLISIFVKTPITDANTDQILIEEIIKHLKRFPMDAQNKSDKIYIQSLAKQLLNYLKNTQLFEDISMRHDLKNQSKANKNYSQPLFEVISKSLPFQDLSADEQLSFNVLKDDISGAFINLHNSGFNEEEKNKHRKKINDAIDKHCDDYLKKHPGTSIDRNKLKQDLYTALKKTSQPINESELERQQEREQYYKIPQRMQQKTDQSYNIIPPRSMLSPADRASADEPLSFNVLKEEISHAFINLQNAGNNEEEKNKQRTKINDAIDKYCNDYLLKHPGPPIDRNKLKQDLYTALKNTSQHINETELEMLQETKQHYKIPQPMQQKTDQNYIIPPCNILSAEDRAHLERIRERSRQNLCPGPGICGGLSECPSLNSKPDLAHRSSGVQTSSHRTEAVGSQVDLSPHVVVKEYYWDSVNTYSELPRLTPSDPCPAIFTPPCQSMSQSYPYSLSPCYSPCGSLSGQTMLKPQRNVIMSHGPSQFTTAGSPSSGYRTDQNLPKFQRYMSQRESQPTTPTASKSYMKSSNSCLQQPSQSGYNVTSQKEPCSSHHRIACSPHPRRPWYMKQNVPITPENYDADPNCSLQRSRVTHLGSFDHVEPKVCNSRSYAWGKRPGNDNKFQRSYRRWLPLDEDFEEAYVNERHNQKMVRCRCKESTLPKCSERTIDQYNLNSMNSCSKCCGGVHCPFPSHMYFRN